MKRNIDLTEDGDFIRNKDFIFNDDWDIDVSLSINKRYDDVYYAKLLPKGSRFLWNGKEFIERFQDNFLGEYYENKYWYGKNNNILLDDYLEDESIEKILFSKDEEYDYEILIR